MEQTKALNALEPFLALSKSATSSRAAADLVARATSSPNTFVFAELLQTPSIAALADSPDFAPHRALLEIFSHGTYEDYVAQQGLPNLTDAQTLKLRQLSLLSFARDRNNLSYDVLARKLGLESHRLVEDLVITAIYAGLVEATLDPARQAVQVTRIAPLRDLSPGAIPEMISILSLWSERCTSVLADLAAQIEGIRCAATVREDEAAATEKKLSKTIEEIKDVDKHRLEPQIHQREVPRRGLNKRTGGPSMSVADDDTMELDDPVATDEQSRRASKRKM